MYESVSVTHSQLLFHGPQMLFYLIGFFAFRDKVDKCIIWYVTTWFGNIQCGFDFITGQNPHGDAGFAQRYKCVFDIVLKGIFYGSRT